MGGNERDDGPRNEADRLLNFFPGAQAIGADDIDLRFGFVGLAAFNNLRKAGARHAAEIATGHDHEVRVERLFGVHHTAMGLSYILLLTAFYVDNGHSLPLWKDLPPIAYRLLPGAFGMPIII